MDKEKSRDLTDMSETEIQHAERRHGGDFSGVKSRRTRRRQEKLGLRKTRGEESNTTEQELHSMTEPEPLEEQTDGELEEVIKDPYEEENYNDIGGNPQKKKAWEVWLEKKEGGERQYDEMRTGDNYHPKNIPLSRVEGTSRSDENPSGIKGTIVDTEGPNCKDCGMPHRDVVASHLGEKLGDKEVDDAIESVNREYPPEKRKKLSESEEKKLQEEKSQEILDRHQKRALQATISSENAELWKSWLEKKEGKKWHCNLCNIELPDDELAEHRKNRHTDFHTDESIRTGGRKRNWTFGDTKYELKAWKSWLEKKEFHMSDLTEGGDGVLDPEKVPNADARISDKDMKTKSPYGQKTDRWRERRDKPKLSMSKLDSEGKPIPTFHKRGAKIREDKKRKDKLKAWEVWLEKMTIDPKKCPWCTGTDEDNEETGKQNLDGLRQIPQAKQMDEKTFRKFVRFMHNNDPEGFHGNVNIVDIDQKDPDWDSRKSLWKSWLEKKDNKDSKDKKVQTNIDRPMHWSGTPPHKRGDPHKTREEIEADFEKSKKRNRVE